MQSWKDNAQSVGGDRAPRGPSHKLEVLERQGMQETELTTIQMYAHPDGPPCVKMTDTDKAGLRLSEVPGVLSDTPRSERGFPLRPGGPGSVCQGDSRVRSSEGRRPGREVPVGPGGTAWGAEMQEGDPARSPRESPCSLVEGEAAKEVAQGATRQENTGICIIPRRQGSCGIAESMLWVWPLVSRPEHLRPLELPG